MREQKRAQRIVGRYYREQRERRERLIAPSDRGPKQRFKQDDLELQGSGFPISENERWMRTPEIYEGKFEPVAHAKLKAWLAQQSEADEAGQTIELLLHERHMVAEYHRQRLGYIARRLRALKDKEALP